MIINRTHRLLIIFILLFSKTTIAQTNAWLWAKSEGGPTYETGVKVATDAAGNIYLAGSYNGNLIIGNDTLYNYSITGDSMDIFIAKYDANGNVLWAKRAGGRDVDNINSMYVDAAGNIYIAGSFISYTITFGTITLTKKSIIDMFVVKYDKNGNVLWAKNADGNGYKSANTIAADRNGNVYVGGSYKFASIWIGSIFLNNAGLEDIFLAKYDAEGNVLWAKRAGLGSDDYATSISIDKNGNIYIAGDFQSDRLIIGNTTLINMDNSENTTDIFLAKYDSEGNVKWAKKLGGEYNDITKEITTDSVGNTSIGAVFSGQMIQADTIIVTNTAFGFDIVIARYNTSGNVVWARGAAGVDHEDVESLVTDKLGNIYIAGEFQSSTLTLDTITLYNGGDIDIFLAKLDANGKVKWAKREGGSDSEFISSISLDYQGNGYITGCFYSNSLIIGNNTLLNEGFADIYLAKLNTQALDIFNKPNKHQGISLYPNPTTKYITVITNKKAKLEITNMSGQNFGKYLNIDKEITINTENFPSGVYTLKATTDKGIEVLKFVKE